MPLSKGDLHWQRNTKPCLGDQQLQLCVCGTWTYDLLLCCPSESSSVSSFFPVSSHFIQIYCCWSHPIHPISTLSHQMMGAARRDVLSKWCKCPHCDVTVIQIQKARDSDLQKMDRCVFFSITFHNISRLNYLIQLKCNTVDPRDTNS